jgi:hypothetical protein
MEGLSAEHLSGDEFSFVVYVLIPLSGEKLSRNYSQVILASDSSFMRVFLNDAEQWCLSPRLEPEIPEKLKTSRTKL